MAELADFHFLRPLWLLALLPLGLLLGMLWHQVRSASGWTQVISPQLLPHLLDSKLAPGRRGPVFAVGLAWLCGSLALAGPSWEETPQPVQRKEDALILLFDLSLSMLAQDMQPSRAARSRHKLLDLLEQRTEGVTGLVAYSGDAHVVSPLTDDIRTIANLLPALEPTIMPVPGSNTAAAVESALGLFHSAGIETGLLLLVSDGVSERDISSISDLLAGTGFRLSVLGVGTREGSPIPIPGRGYLKDSAGSIVIPALEEATLEKLANRNGGMYARVTLDDSDLKRVMVGTTGSDEYSEVEGRSIETWEDAGFWLVLLLLPISLFSFRRGWLLCLPLAVILLQPPPAQAFEWADLWLTPDQRGQQALRSGDAEAAAELFEDPAWSGTANYRAGDFVAAEEAFAAGDNADSWFNRGNALARAGRLDDAIAAYEKALQQQPEMEDAAFNRALVEQLQQQQQQQQDSDSEQEQDSNSEQQQGSESQQQQSSRDEQQGDEQSPSQQESQQDSQGQDQSSGQQQQSDAETPEPGKPQAGEDDPDSNGEEQQQAAANSDGEQEPEQEAQPAPGTQGPEPTQEEQERAAAAEQWLRQIPDDPSGLLRRKFQYESQQRGTQRGKDDEAYW